MAYATVSQRHGNVQDDALPLLDRKLVEQLAADQGYHWREGKLTPGKTARCFAWQIVMGNVPCDAVRHRFRGDFTASAYCQARQRLPRSVLEVLSQRTAQSVMRSARRRGQEDRWRGHRVLRIDGSSASLPDSPEVREYFGCSSKQKPGCGYPTTHLLLLTAGAGVGVKIICSPLRTGDMTHASRMHEHLQPGDLLMGDSLFGGWGYLHQLQTQQLHGLFPSHHSRQIAWGKHADHGRNRRWVRSLGWRDQLVAYRKPNNRPKWMSRKAFDAAPQWILVREIEREVKVGGVRRKVVVVTTLTDAKKYPPKEVVRLLGERWLIETQLRSLKTTMGMQRLRCQSVDGVRKELLMYLIVYNLVRLLMLTAASRQNIDAKRVSFADALARLRYGIATVAVDLEIVPLRPGRIEPRVVKWRGNTFPYMSKPRPLLRRLLLHARHHLGS